MADIEDIKFDYKTLKFIKEYALQPEGDDKLLLTIVKFFEKEGFNFIDWKKECKDLFVKEENLSKKIPNKIIRPLCFVRVVIASA